ncbi:MAG: hypothetical protein KKB95_01495 [Gammaproteobacteria bacterium]|nr:hypothetical protein [Gammaproteobacteria bacterium]MBU1504548.1 hypothetical protein [Gammaproteobacteria bacterium]MBU2119410.1 hypothetical protein [Gammaproteobacteria bacterium]MBU2202823.1 hypothetical protein [Gammaproteobacteria bacterium]MBU2272562.1 hypothetical protein [Gammaproteobacteria bacterium]
MNQQQVAFLRRLIETEPPFRPYSATAEYFLNAEGVGKVQGRRVVYTQRDFAAARHLLFSRGFEPSRQVEPVPRSRVQPGESEKWGSLRVSEGLVAVVPLGLKGVQIPTGSMLCMDVRQALALPYEVLVFCENLEPMLRLHDYQWLAGFLNGRPALVLFRGAPGYFRTDMANELLVQDSRPVLAFFDFDPKGLSMAASVPRREALCLPPLDGLEVAVKGQRRKDLYLRSVEASRPHLEAQPSEGDVGLAWGLMKRLEMGLDQEHFAHH